MTVKQIADAMALTVLTGDVALTREVERGCVCDLLSLVMARGDENAAWITVQTHMNVVAVASLHDFSCVIVAENSEVGQDVLDKAAGENIAVLSSPLPEYELAGRLYALGVRGC